MNKNYLLCLGAMLLMTKANAQLHVSTAGTKNVLVEVGVGTWTGWAPDAFQDIQERILPTYPNAIIAAWHNMDPMAISGDPYGTTGYISGYPMATIDRSVFGTAVGQNRPWESFVGQRDTVAPKFDVDMMCTYNPVTRVIDVTVTGRALSSLTGIWYMNGLVIEDSIGSGPDTTYNQRNYYGTTYPTSCTGSPSWFAGFGNPISPTSNFAHMYVVRNVLCPGGNIWGESAFINPTAGATSTKHYSYTLPSTSDYRYVKVVGLVQKYGATTDDRAIENAVTAPARSMPAGHTTATADSFTVYTNGLCSGPDFYIATNSYRAGMTVTTEYGDGASGTATILSGGVSGGYAGFSHSYTTPGSYTVKHILSDGTGAIDSTTYTYEYTLCNDMALKFYFDANSNCAKDSSEPYIFGADLTAVDSNGVTIDTIAATSGFYYRAYGNPGDIYTFRVLSIPTGLSLYCPSTGVIYDTLRSTSYSLPTKYFGLTCTSTSNFDITQYASFRANTNRGRASMILSNLYCTPTDATVSMNFSPKYEYYSASPSPASVVGNTITWNVSALSEVSGPVNIGVMLKNNTTLGLLVTGDTVHSDYFAFPHTGDDDSTDNDCHHEDTVRGAYDPNYVAVSPEGYITAGTTLEYTIGFENTGNDTAFNIHVMDTLSDFVDPRSMTIVASSAEMVTAKLTNSGHTVLKFDFPNINLLDSSHHNQCHGMVVFNIKTKAGLAPGTLITNHAGIFFDSNPAVLTNTAINIIGSPSKTINVAVAETVSIYPNPAHDQLTIKMDKMDYSSATITNIVGPKMLQQAITGNTTNVDIKSLASGIYYVTLQGANATKVMKVVKN